MMYMCFMLLSNHEVRMVRYSIYTILEHKIYRIVVPGSNPDSLTVSNFGEITEKRVKTEKTAISNSVAAVWWDRIE